ncbi:MAG: hypothetical protein UT53_C0014G0018 [Candidatus Yanofskybacteria bacterium GW2011_GWD2_39_48]|uniref:Obg domain-containing protein n=1 Tax=Candidatus Yanofskybacteria bacterium GW2011_GWD2_39_48 TaxID=1619031 RepID=A0A0G0RM34_9BACT|nr:MAG: hypothetical protein UT53_C0014G0018 [Candidatus Yanofskybacteria bacterium GW2011_GWD2_39_48]
MLVDELKIKVVAGKGGDGTVSFNKNKIRVAMVAVFTLKVSQISVP